MLHLPTLRDIQRGLAAGDAQNAYETLSPLRGTPPAAYPKNGYTEKLLQNAAQKADELDAHLIPTLPFDLFRLFEETGDRSQYEHIYFNEYAYRNAANALALLKTGEEKYRRALENGLWALCDAYTWALPAHLWGNGLKVLHDPGYEDGGRDEYACHDRPCTTEVDLFGSMMAHDVSQMLYLFGDTLSPLVVRRVREEIRRRIFDPLMTFDKAHFWETCENNWGAVCAGCVGCAAIYSIRDSRLLAPILTRMCQATEGFLEGGFDRDGICEEGLSYWEYGFRNFVTFAELLRRRTAGTVDLFAIEKVRRIAHFPAKSMLNGLDVVSFSDSPQTIRLQAGLLHYLHHRVPETALPADEVLAEPECDHFYYACFELEHYDPALTGAAGFTDGATVYEGAEWIVSRRTVNGKHLGFAAKGGPNMVSHNHNDAGSFIVDVNGFQMLCDPGSGLYTRQYFDPNVRYDGLPCGSHGHSVPMISGRHQMTGLEYRAENTVLTAADDADALTCDLACAYGFAGVKQLRRALRFDHADGSVTVTDCFTPDGEEETLTERFVSWVEPVQTADGLLLEHDGDRVLLCADAPVSWHTEPFPTHSDGDRPLWLIDYVPAAGKGETVFRLTVRPL